MKVNVYGIDGQKTSTQVELNDSVFGIEPNDHVIWLDVKAILANRRQGTHKTKGRSEVSGGGKKPFRQKGTGRARQGTIRAPHFVGGGRVFGPQPRDYSQKVNKKVKKLARRSALSHKAKEEKILVVQNFNYDKPSTKEMLNMLKSFELDNKKVLLCTAEYAPMIVKSAGNLYNVEVRESNTFSTYDVLKADTIILQEGALQKVNEVLSK
ncbi:50S ribosomal protein L4 [candidate division KSB1 bacterium]|jgi:large subunit ribosomal protein L4|nr:MAG: 50S ribosomal protein L4 [candidate division KSB1 bacterium]